MWTHLEPIDYSNCFADFRELQSTFARLSRQVDLAKEDLSEELKKLADEIGKLDNVASRANYLK